MARFYANMPYDVKI